jgi:acetyl esterase
MTLHPQAVDFLTSLPDQPEVHSPGFGVEQVRERRATAREAALAEPREPVAHVADLDADGVPVRIYRPREGAPVVLHLHGGGWVFGDLETHDRFCRWFVGQTGCAVLAVDYRVAPEHPYPAPLDDCEIAGSWLREHAARLSVDASNLVVMGDSAGANLAAGLAVRHPEWFSLQVLVYPCVDPTGSTPSYAVEDAGLSGASMDWFWAMYTPEPADRERVDVAPWRAELTGLPAAVVLTAEHDPLRDEGEVFAQRLAAAGVPVVATRWQGMVHGFWRMPHHFDAARAAVHLVAGVMREIRGA